MNAALWKMAGASHLVAVLEFCLFVCVCVFAVFPSASAESTMRAVLQLQLMGPALRLSQGGKEAPAGETQAPAPQVSLAGPAASAGLGEQVRKRRGPHSQGERHCHLGAGLGRGADGEQGPWRSPSPCWALLSLLPLPCSHTPKGTVVLQTAAGKHVCLA